MLSPMNAGSRPAADVVTLRDGTPVLLRPIRADDEARMAAFHAGLSPRSVHQRYFHVSSLAQRITQSRLALTCRVDPALGLALVGERGDDGGVLGLGLLTRTDPTAAEVALLVMDHWQGKGLGRALLRRLLHEARALGLRRLHGDMLADNDAMRAVMRHHGFVVAAVPGDAAVLRAELDLS